MTVGGSVVIGLPLEHSERNDSGSRSVAIGLPLEQSERNDSRRNAVLCHFGSFSIYRLNFENNFGENLILIIKFSLNHLNVTSNHTSYGR